MGKKRRSISDLIESAGGAGKISAALQISPDAVYKWRDIGIPDRHWPVLLAMTNATAEEMLAANISARTGVRA